MMGKTAFMIDTVKTSIFYVTFKRVIYFEGAKTVKIQIFKHNARQATLTVMVAASGMALKMYLIFICACTGHIIARHNFPNYSSHCLCVCQRMHGWNINL